MSGVGSVHVWGFFDDDGNPRQPDGAAPSDQIPYHHHRTVERNVTHFGGTITALRTTSTLDGWLVATEFETPAHHRTARMWHRILRPSDPWPDPTLRKRAEARATAPVSDSGHGFAPGAVRDDESASVARDGDGVIESNLRVVQHEINTPMRGHDDDGACCRAARDGENK